MLPVQAKLDAKAATGLLIVLSVMQDTTYGLFMTTPSTPWELVSATLVAIHATTMVAPHV